MSRRSKKAEKEQVEIWAPPGELRLLKRYADDDGVEWEQIAFKLDDVKVRETADQVKALEANITLKAAEVSKAKAELASMNREKESLIRRMVNREFTETVMVHRYLDEKAGVVHLYDSDSHEKLGERALEEWERQEIIDFEADSDEGSNDDEGDNE